MHSQDKSNESDSLSESLFSNELLMENAPVTSKINF